MKRFAIVCCSVLLAALAAPAAQAQTAPGVHVGVATGPGAPVGDSRDSFETGFNGSAFVNWIPDVSPVGLRVEGMYQNLDIEPQFGEGGDAEILAGLAGAVIAPKTGTVKPYAVGGGGIYNVDVDRQGLVSGGTNNTEFGWNAGGGVAFPLGKTNIFVEARYHSINTEGEDRERVKLVPVTVGITF